MHKKLAILFKLTIIIFLIFLLACSNKAKVNILIQQGQEEFNKGNYLEAHSLFKKASAINQDTSRDIYFWLGMSELYLGQNYNAISSFTKSLEIDQKPESFKFRGLTYSALMNYKDALKVFNQAIFLDTTDAQLYFYRSKTELWLGEISKAYQDIDKAIILEDNNDSYYAKRAICKSKLNDIKGAIQDINKAIKINPKEAEYYYLKGDFYSKINQKKLAVKYLSIANELGHMFASSIILEKYPDEYNKMHIIAAPEVKKIISLDYSSKGNIILGSGVDNFVTTTISLKNDLRSIKMDLVCTFTRSSVKMNCVEKGEAALIFISDEGKNYALKNIDRIACINCEAEMDNSKLLCEIVLTYEIEASDNFPIRITSGRINQTQKLKSGILQINNELYSFNIDDPLFLEKN